MKWLLALCALACVAAYCYSMGRLWLAGAWLLWTHLKLPAVRWRKQR